MKNTPKVSVIIPVYNGERFITCAIETVLAQTYTNLELIIVNDGSKDGSYEKILPYLELPNVHYFVQENKGVAAARNSGILNSGGEYIALLDQDDLWLPEKLSLQVHEMERQPELGFVHSNISFIDSQGDPISPPEWKWVSNASGHCLRELFLGNKVATLTALIRKKCLDEVGLFDQKTAPADDWDLWLRLALKYQVGFISDVTALYRLHEENESRNLLKMQLAMARVVESFVQSHPESIGIIKKQDIAQKRYEFSCEIARLLERQGAGKEAFGYWRKASQIYPWSWSCYVEMIWCLLSREQQRKIRWYRHKLATMFSVEKG